jgi:hypothetical protein
MRIIILLLLLITVLSCVEQPGPLICETYYHLDPCFDGSYISSCVSLDMSKCGYQAVDVFYNCISCEPLECDSAANWAIHDCYEGFN